MTEEIWNQSDGTPWSQGLFASVDNNLTILEIGDDCLTLTKHEVSDVLGQPLFKLFTSESHFMLERAIRKGFDGKSVCVECTILSKQGDSLDLQIVSSPSTVRNVISHVDLFIRKTESTALDRRKIPNMISRHMALPVILHEIAAALEEEFPDGVVSIAYESIDKQSVLHVETDRMPTNPKFSPRLDDRSVHCAPAWLNNGTISTPNIQEQGECSICSWLASEENRPACWSRVLLSPHGEALGKFSVHSLAHPFPLAGLEDTFKLYSSMAELAIWNNFYESSLVKQSERDELTGLFNFRKFSSVLTKVTSHQINACVLYIDLDQFGFVNESLGHAIGNRILFEVAQIIDSWSRPTYISGRIAGDAFGVILPNTPSHQAVERGEELLSRLEQPIELPLNTVHLTASIGVSAGSDASTLIDNAFRGCNEAKTFGGNTVSFYTRQRDANTLRAFELMRDMHTALQHNQLDVHYQPRVNPFTGEIVAGEALLRWNHPDWGMVPPDEFIGILERQGLMFRVGQWLVRRVCSDLKQWNQLSEEAVPISVNFSPIELTRPGAVEFLVRTLSEHGLSTNLLEVELTERLSVRRHDLMIKAINDLNHAGIRTYIDDFGETTIPLSYLQKSFVHGIKIEKYLTDKLTKGSSTVHMMSSLIAMCQSVGIRTIVEGVEAREQVLLLRDMNCNEIQGYFFSKPVPADTFQILIENRRITRPDHIPTIERRNVSRIHLSCPLIGKVTVTQIAQRVVNVGWSDILIPNIGLQGLTLVTPLRFPVDRLTVLRIKTMMFGDIELTANLMYVSEFRPGLYKCGVQFVLSDSEEILLLKKLNNLSLELKRTPLPQGCSVYGDKAVEFFKVTSQ